MSSDTKLVERLLSGPLADDGDRRDDGPIDLRAVVRRQAREIQQLRAVLFGIVDALDAVIDADDLEDCVASAWDDVRGIEPRADVVVDAAEAAAPAPGFPLPEGVRERLALVTPSTPMTDPYRGLPAKPTPEMLAAADALLQEAYKHHYARRFPEAREIYKKIVEDFGLTGYADIARQQLENLRDA